MKSILITLTLAVSMHAADPVTIYKPENANGTSVIVCPGGGYSILAIEHEGTQVCQYLNTLGVTGVLLKYRVPKRDPADASREPLQDAQRAIGILRHRAEEFGMKPSGLPTADWAIRVGEWMKAMGWL
jgi:acetyl esterase/lipase